MAAGEHVRSATTPYRPAPSPIADGTDGLGQRWSVAFPAGTTLTRRTLAGEPRSSPTPIERDAATEAMVGAIVAGRKRPIRGVAGAAGVPVFHNP